MRTLNPKQVDFKFGEYISQGFELFKKDIGGFVLAGFFTMIMSIIPFCSFLAIGNFMKYCRKVNKGQQASASEIFNFDDFMAYFILNLMLIGFMFALMIPYFVIIFMSKSMESGGGAGIMSMILFLLMFAAIFALYYFMIKGFYIVPLISLENKKDLKENWNISKIMTANNLLIIFLFALVASFIGQLGVILCGIGIFLTLPVTYTMYYMAYEDGLNQIKIDEIEEIGVAPVL